jgi:glycosyltransferase involved in cell wall biosynthesis
MPNLTIIIPTFNQVDRLKYTLKQIAIQDGINEMEVILINDGSTDGTFQYVEQLEYKWLTVIHQENQGRSQARNNGFQRAKSPFVLFLDSDIILCPGYLKTQLAAQIAHPGIYFGDLYNIHFNDVELCNSMVKKNNMKSREPFAKLETIDVLVNMARFYKLWNKNGRVGWPCLTAANFSAPLSILQEAGLFDEKFIGWGVEDHEYAFRLKMTGAKFFFLDTIYGLHLDKPKEAINIPSLVENLMYFYRKHNKDSEVRAYLEFVSGHNSLQNLYYKTMKSYPMDNGSDLFFKPYKHIQAKQEM